MCRWLSYVGEPVYLKDFIFKSGHSLVEQSLHSEMGKTAVNGDGFGVGWFGERKTPGTFRDILPAWGDENLKSIAHQIRSRLFMAHVRASTGTASIRTNSHPFTYKSSLFMHNGQIGEYLRYRKSFEMLLDEIYFRHRQGTTDSELIFLLAIQNGLIENPAESIAKTLGQVLEVMRENSVREPLRFSVAFTHKGCLSVFRYASDHFPPTVFFKKIKQGYLVVSEPLDDNIKDWEALGKNRLLTIDPSGDVRFRKISLPRSVERREAV